MIVSLLFIAALQVSARTILALARSAELFDEMDQVLSTVLNAPVFHEVSVYQQRRVPVDLERPGIGPRIVDSNLELQVRGIGTLVTLDDMHRVGMWVAGSIEPRLVFESNRDHKRRVTFPMAPRVTVIRGHQVVRGMVAPDHKDLPVAVLDPLKKEND